MPNNITDVDTFTATIQTVADGDAASAANFALGVQGLANRTLNLKNRLDLVTSGTYTPTGVAVTGLSAVSPYECHYIRVGNIVTVNAVVLVTNSLSGSKEFSLTLPVARSGNFASTLEAMGVTDSGFNGSYGHNVGSVSGSQTVLVKANNTGAAGFSVTYATFSYKLA